VHSREQADLLSALEPAVLEWGAARDRGEHDSDDPPPEILGRLAALARQHGGADIGGGDEGLVRRGQGGGGAVMAGMDRPVGLGRAGSGGGGRRDGGGGGRGGGAGHRGRGGGRTGPDEL
jgi:hypothetical protein